MLKKTLIAFVLVAAVLGGMLIFPGNAEARIFRRGYGYYGPRVGYYYGPRYSYYGYYGGPAYYRPYYGSYYGSYYRPYYYPPVYSYGPTYYGW